MAMNSWRRRLISEITSPATMMAFTPWSVRLEMGLVAFHFGGEGHRALMRIDHLHHGRFADEGGARLVQLVFQNGPPVGARPCSPLPRRRKKPDGWGSSACIVLKRGTSAKRYGDGSPYHVARAAAT